MKNFKLMDSAYGYKIECTVQLNVQYSWMYSTAECTVQLNVQYSWMYSTAECVIHLFLGLQIIIQLHPMISPKDSNRGMKEKIFSHILISYTSCQISLLCLDIQWCSHDDESPWCEGLWLSKFTSGIMQWVSKVC